MHLIGIFASSLLWSSQPKSTKSGKKKKSHQHGLTILWGKRENQVWISSSLQTWRDASYASEMNEQQDKQDNWRLLERVPIGKSLEICVPKSRATRRGTAPHISCRGWADSNKDIIRFTSVAYPPKPCVATGHTAYIFINTEDVLIRIIQHFLFSSLIFLIRAIDLAAEEGQRQRQN